MNHRKSTLTALGAAVFAAALAFAGCSNPAGEPSAQGGTGKITVSLAIDGSPAAQSLPRTAHPDTSLFTGYKLLFTATSGGANYGPVDVTSSGTASPVTLTAGTYSITATAYTSGGGSAAIAETIKTGIQIVEGATTEESIILGPKTGGANGTFKYDVTLTDVTGTLYITTLDGTAAPNGTVTLTGGVNNVSVPLAPGVYRLRARLEGSGSAGGFNDVIHIYTGLDSVREAASYTADTIPEATDEPVTASSLTGFFPAPATNEPPTREFDGDQYTGAIAWKAGGADFSGTAFAASTAYTAVVTLTAKQGWTFDGAGPFTHGSITGTTGTEGNVITFVFPATAAQSSSLSVTLGFGYDAITVTGSDGVNTIVKPSGSLALSVTGFSDIAWYLDGNETSLGGDNPVTLSAGDYTAGPHVITFEGVKDGLLYAKEVPFAVEAAVSASVTPAGLADYLAGLPDGTVESPSTVVFTSFDITSDTWGTTVKNALAASTKYVVLDLSACTATNDTITGGGYEETTGNDFNVIMTDYTVGVILPLSLKTIGTNALSCWLSLRSVEIPEGVTSIGESSFYYCPDLTSVVIPSTVTSIASFAFGSNDSLTSLTLKRWEAPSTITTMANTDALFEASNDLRIYVPNTEAQTYYKTATNWKNFANKIFVAGN
jgi:hypothetical protein